MRHVFVVYLCGLCYIVSKTFIKLYCLSHNDDERFWSNATVDDWGKEMAGMRVIIEKFANVTDNSVVGVRAPYLRVGGNNQFTMMEEQAFLYDSTITAPLSNPPYGLTPCTSACLTVATVTCRAAQPGAMPCGRW